MKRIIFLLSFMMIGLFVQSQTTFLEKPVYKVTKDAYTYKYEGRVAVDSLTVKRDSIAYPIYLESPNPTWYDFKIHLDEITSPARITTKLQGKKFLEDTWADVTSKVYYGGGTDTTILFNQTTTLQHYNYYRLLFIHTNNKANVGMLTGVFKR